MTSQPTDWEVTYDLLRELGLTTVFGNPGSAELCIALESARRASSADG